MLTVGTYSWIEYQSMFACCAVGAGNTADISAPKTIANIVHLVNQFPQTGYTHEQIVQTLEKLVSQEDLMKVEGDEPMYQRPKYVVCRQVMGLAPNPIVTIVKMRGRTISKLKIGGIADFEVMWEFMIPPNLCDMYNDSVYAVLHADFTRDMHEAGSLEGMAKITKAFKTLHLGVLPTEEQNRDVQSRKRSGRKSAR